MNDITVITPPDMLLNDSFSVCVICADELLKNTLHEIFLSSFRALNIYIYENCSEDNLSWLLRVIKLSDFVLLNLDNCDPITKVFASHIIAQANCFYLTNDNLTPYNLISKNRIYDLAILENILNNRGNNE